MSPRPYQMAQRQAATDATRERVLADSDVPLAFRVCEHWFGGLFVNDQFMRELLPAKRGPARSVWAELS